ncbi:hypothetical protein FLJC2902T_10880 [Flavobacterium limnosediminis JC2902]|uniref:Uncharacterized protein n=1 Tax=Flavobacterium limnosediminis JC2902 TaxID=1341181 RepID=V6SQY1_9FLAO|nr:hypothetical protein FLJC2902T_10880 [Flavobacterium limnosediminis JC2902]
MVLQPNSYSMIFFLYSQCEIKQQIGTCVPNGAYSVNREYLPIYST